MRYCKNTSKADCVPVSLANAIKWSGHKFSYKKNKKNFELLYTEGKEQGVSYLIFRAYLYCFLSDLPFKVIKEIRNFNTSQLRRKLNKDRALIMFMDIGDTWHACLLLDMTKHYVKVANYGGRAITKISINKLRKHLKYSSLGFIIQR